MKVHHLNCGTMRPPTLDPIVCHVLLVETDNGLVLVDTGYGLADIEDQARRIGAVRHLLRPDFAPEETAAHHVERLGFRRTDVRDIVVTHFDLDHIGGISDFPDARVHVTTAEANAAMRAPKLRERSRYRPAQWEHRPTVVEHDPTGEKWRGFAAAKELEDISPGIVLVSVPGHSRGHAAVAVDAGDRWILHCGDAFFHRGTVDKKTPIPAALKAFTAATALNMSQMRENQERIAELYRRADPDLLIICSHDSVMFNRAVSD